MGRYTDYPAEWARTVADPREEAREAQALRARNVAHDISHARLFRELPRQTNIDGQQPGYQDFLSVAQRRNKDKRATIQRTKANRSYIGPTWPGAGRRSRGSTPGSMPSRAATPILATQQSLGTRHPQKLSGPMTIDSSSRRRRKGSTAKDEPQEERLERWVPGPDGEVEAVNDGVRDYDTVIKKPAHITPVRQPPFERPLSSASDNSRSSYRPPAGGARVVHDARRLSGSSAGGEIVGYTSGYRMETGLADVSCWPVGPLRAPSSATAEQPRRRSRSGPQYALRSGGLPQTDVPHAVDGSGQDYFERADRGQWTWMRSEAANSRLSLLLPSSYLQWQP